MKISCSRTVGITALVLMLWLGPSWGQGTTPTNSDPQRNTAGGTNALVNNLNLNTGFGNTAFGDSALLDNMTGDNNTAVGVDALIITLAQSQPGAMCPQVGRPSVPCDASGNCFRHCCLSSGLCPTFSCVSSLDADDDAGTMCTGKCQEEVACRVFNPAFIADCPPGLVCIGTVVCKTRNCDGRTAGDVCLIAGEAVRICTGTF